ncbi:hypothetical protein [Microcoleus sp. OTE_8_concoct_300]|uniref:hypothetical protein n=1 Tax=Microcoleus sp. OTE_8_concoct_300 TaxID=2964710 RepID=UPI00403F76B5
MIKLRKQSLALVGTFIAVLQPAFTANSQESNSEFSKLQSLLEAKKWYEGVGMGFLDRLHSSIKNLKSIVGRAKPRLPRPSRDGISPSPRLFNLKSQISNLKSPDFHVEVGRGFLDRLDSSIKNQKSKIKNRLMTNNYGIRQILMVRSGLQLTKVLLSLEIATEVTN